MMITFNTKETRALPYSSEQGADMRAEKTHYVSRFLNMLFPKTCINCGRDLPHDDAQYTCGACWSTIKKIEGLYCAKCSKPLAYGGEHCVDCAHTKTPYDRIIAAVHYEGVIREYLHRIKFRKQSYLLKPLGELLATAVEGQMPPVSADALIPVPLHRARRRERGFNQSEILAEILSTRFHIPVRNEVLMRTANTQPQYGLIKQKRLNNIAGAFTVSSRAPRPLPRRVILVDDICTTSATFYECSRMLRRSGVKKVLCLALARD
jgi:ComF family protein